MRKKISSGAKWEEIAGYSRAVKVGNIIEISGTVASDGKELIGRGNAYLQTKFILKKIESVLIAADSSLNDIVRTRIYVNDISKWEDVAKAHREVFENIRPATSMVEVSNLISPEYIVEIEATAIIDN